MSRLLEFKTNHFLVHNQDIIGLSSFIETQPLRLGDLELFFIIGLAVEAGAGGKGAALVGVKFGFNLLLNDIQYPYLISICIPYIYIFFYFSNN